MASPRVAVAPNGTRSWLADAVAAGGAEVVDPDDAGAVVWTHHADPGGLAGLLTTIGLGE